MGDLFPHSLLSVRPNQGPQGYRRQLVLSEGNMISMRQCPIPYDCYTSTSIKLTQPQSKVHSPSSNRNAGHWRKTIIMQVKKTWSAPPIQQGVGPSALVSCEGSPFLILFSLDVIIICHWYRWCLPNFTPAYNEVDGKGSGPSPTVGSAHASFSFSLLASPSLLFAVLLLTRLTASSYPATGLACIVLERPSPPSGRIMDGCNPRAPYEPVLSCIVVHSKSSQQRQRLSLAPPAPPSPHPSRRNLWPPRRWETRRKPVEAMTLHSFLHVLPPIVI